MAEANVVYAVKSKLHAFEAESRIEVKRRIKVVESVRALVSDLEKASGALPLK